MPEIDFKAKTDRELLLLTAQACNQLTEERLPAIEAEMKGLNTCVRGHEGRLIELETAKALGLNPWYRKPRTYVISGGVASALALIVAIIYALGTAAGWW